MTYRDRFCDDPTYRQRDARAPVSLLCDLRQGQRQRPWNTARLTNLSQGGFCMEWLPTFDLERSLWIRIPGLQLLQANIRWRRSSQMGCEFSARLYGPVFEHIARQAAAQV